MTEKTTQAAECLSRLNAELDTTSDKILFYAKDIDPKGGFFGVTSVTAQGKVSSSTIKNDWLKKTKDEWLNIEGISSSNFDVDYLLVSVDEKRCPISSMTEQQSHDISNAMVKAIENRDHSKLMVFVKS